MADLTGLATEAIKLAQQARYSCAIWVTTLIVWQFPRLLGFDELSKELRPYLGTVWLLFFVVWVFQIAIALRDAWWERRKRKKELEDLLKPLDSLKPAEAAILVRALDAMSQMVEVAFDSSAVASLASKGLLEKVTPFEGGRYMVHHPYNVPLRVWERINRPEVAASLRHRAVTAKLLQ